MAPHLHDPSEHAHQHDFAVMVERGERRTRAVVLITIAMMIAELVTGYVTGSMALTADGWHMATHAGALGLALFAYWFARTRSSSSRFTFGTGKVYALAGYTSGVSLGVIALWMGVEAGLRLFDHPEVDFVDALPVAIIGLVVNLVSALLLGGGHGHTHDHGHDHHDHDHDDHGHHDHGHAHDDEQLTDHNLRAAYFHVLADALTSVLAIAALVAGEFAGIWWLDPAMGFVGGVLIAKWAVTLCRDAAAQLVDATPTEDIADQISKRLTKLDDVQVADLHVWELAPGKRGCIVSVVSARPRDVDFYRKEILGVVQLAHLTVEIHGCENCDPARSSVA
jgi:cation diffusion facilitator family transporter